MDHRRHILPSSFNSSQLPLDDPVVHSRVRQPLSDSAGNAQLHALASVGLYHDSKGLQPRVERPIYSIPTVPSQPARHPAPNSLELRRQHTRRRRQYRHTRNPIQDSAQYQAYRARQIRDGSSESEAKWPGILEDAFLDALIDIPAMGRRKFSLRGKPHGRNELISDYLWIAYCQSLSPGQEPDKTMERTRKQVSSHIQVLKGFFRDHPAFERLFPPNKAPKNGLEDNFKSDPCLRALSEGRLPSRRQEQYMEINQLMQIPIRPAAYWLLITSEIHPNDVHWRLKTETDLQNDNVVLHKYTGLSEMKPRASLESVQDWRARWPYLSSLHSSDGIGCDIIHMEASLKLMTDHARGGAELLSRTEMTLHGTDLAECIWQSVTTIQKPAELYGQSEDPPMAATVSPVEISAVTANSTRIRLQFPANAWAHAFTCLTNLHLEFEENRKAASYGDNGVRGPTKSARELVDQISMYQELQSSHRPGMPFIRRAIIVWTFQKTRGGEQGTTSWRYLDAAPQRSLIMSPPHASHHIAATMNENFGTWADTPIDLQTQNIMDPFGAGLVTPPHTAGLQSPFASNTFLQPASQYDMPPEHLSFVSDATADSESTLVNHDTTNNIDSFLSNPAVNINDYDQTNNSWQIPSAESFDADPSSWANYTVPSTTPQLPWDSPPKHENSWNESQENPKHHTWVDEPNTHEKQHWNSNNTSPSKHYTDHNNENEHPKNYGEVGSVNLPSMNVGTAKNLHHGWVGNDGFDYDHLASRLK
ncbi:transcription factor [Phlyctema vagabunda]|uniref:Transcription factor n=1 Tax=Phlyctema vagabunda TaxID=108571 RepID=A0ABR4PGI6_9HELO